jgi:hypothetical protein
MKTKFLDDICPEGGIINEDCNQHWKLLRAFRGKGRKFKEVDDRITPSERKKLIKKRLMNDYLNFRKNSKNSIDQLSDEEESFQRGKSRGRRRR